METITPVAQAARAAHPAHSTDLLVITGLNGVRLMALVAVAVAVMEPGHTQLRHIKEAMPGRTAVAVAVDQTPSTTFLRAATVPQA